MAAVQVTPVDSRRDHAAFVDFPYRHYRDQPLWVPPLRRDVRTLLSPARNPFFEHAEARHFLARTGGRVVGRITATHNRLHNEFHQDRVGFFGFFESVDDAEVAGALFEAAGSWLRARQLDVMRGPASFSTNDEAGLLVEGFDDPPSLLMPYNPPYYQGLVEGAGFVKAKDLLTYQNFHYDQPQRLGEGTALLKRRYGITVRTLEMRRFADEVERIKRLYNAAWERNWGFVPMTDREIDHLAAQLKPVVDPKMVLFAERREEPIGFAVGIPDLNEVLRGNRSGRLLPGLLRILWGQRRIRRARVILLGSVPEWRGKGIDAMLYHHIWTNANARGIYTGEGGWVLEDNQAMKNGLIRMGFEHTKTYRMYDRPL